MSIGNQDRNLSKDKEIPKEAKRYLKQVMQEADAKRKYRWAITIYERFNTLYSFDEHLQYILGLLYDHLAIFKTEKLKNQQKKVKLLKKYFSKAKQIYEAILKKNPNNALALHGLQRVYESQHDYIKGLYFGKKAYAAMQRFPSRQKRTLAIGNTYLLMGDDKNAEKWFKKELKDRGKNNLSAQANLLLFYNETKNYPKAKYHARITEKLLKREFQKPIYKNMNTSQNNATLKFIDEQIRKALAYKKPLFIKKGSGGKNGIV